MIELRRAGVDDVSALIELASAAYRMYVPRMGRRPAPMTADYAELVDSAEVWVAIDPADGAGRIQGMIVVEPGADGVLIENVAVDPGAQGSGIGGRLLAFAEEEALRRGYGRVWLYTNEKMTENLTYYPRRGYVETHRAVQNGFHRVFFAKELTAGQRQT